MNDPEIAKTLVSRSTLAELAGISKATLKIWHHRHPDCPGPADVDDRGWQYYDLAQMLEWLDRRPIPGGSRGRTEREGATYGMRARRKVAVQHHNRLAEIDEPDEPQLSTLVNTVLVLLRRWGHGGRSSDIDHVTAALCMIFLRICDPESWAALISLAQNPSTQSQVLTELGRRLDTAVQRHGIAANMSSVLGQLNPRPATEVERLIRMVDALGPRAFAILVRRFDVVVELGSTEYFTPVDVADLMAGCVVDPTSSAAVLYDPHVRGGELLRSAVGRYQPDSIVTVRGSGTRPELLRLAGLSLATTGRSTTLRASTSAPWTDDDSLSQFADVVITNPPFNLRSGRRNENHEITWLFGVPPPHNDNYAWLSALRCQAAPRWSSGSADACEGGPVGQPTRAGDPAEDGGGRRCASNHRLAGKAVSCH